MPHVIFFCNSLTIQSTINTTRFIFEQIVVSSRLSTYDDISFIIYIYGYLRNGIIKYKYNCIHVNIFTDTISFSTMAHLDVTLHYEHVSE